MPQDSSTTNYQLEDLRSKFDDLRLEVSTAKNDIHRVSTDLNLIKNDYAKILDMLTKINDNFDKMYVMVNKLSNNGTATEVTSKFMKEEIDNTKVKLSKLESKVDELSRWIWIASGAGAVVGFLLDTIVKVFK